MSTLSWLTNAEIWDTLVLYRDGERYPVPGIARVRPTKALEVERHTVAGRDGATATQLGYRPASFTVDVQIWEEAHYQEMTRILELFQPRRGEDFKAVDVLHPQLEQLNIKQVYLMRVSSEPPSSSEGQRYTFEFEEFYPEGERTPRPVKEVEPATGNPEPSINLPAADANVTRAQLEGAQVFLPAMPSGEEVAP